MYVKLVLALVRHQNKGVLANKEEPTLAQESDSLRQGGIVIKKLGLLCF
jgi:hypothetical protein